MFFSIIAIGRVGERYSVNTMNYELIGILITVVVQALYIAFKIGRFEEKLNSIEKKQEKHNNLIERMVRVEDSVTAAHKRLDDKGM